MQRAAIGACGRAPPARFFRAARPVLAADKEALLELRRRTGLPFVQCREALQRCGGDRGKAEAWLQDQAQQRGWARASILRGRPTPQGLVGLLREGTAAAMVEVNCETDFVARTGEFQQLVELVAVATMGHCRASKQATACDKHLLQEEELMQLRGEPGGALLREQLALAMGKLGEKLNLRRAGWLRVPEGEGLVATYTHGWLPTGPAPVVMGTYGALVALGVTAEGPPPPQATLEEVGRKVAQHVVGMAPTSLGTPQDPPGGEGETRLLAQGFLLQPEVTLGQWVREQGGAVAVRGFLRFQCGEETGEGEAQSGEGTRDVTTVAG
ncbi:elongation factor Ts, mitochondrial isoform X1 [Apus apus]|uniref:elongation factor Ts, mitochondrial isoform X1 n=1 Tax=Apus apus TaxID=8895 RepID=UPI0021F83326|nr:elongation factor Ts, mitochondrial isoform X1 [Apus apus]